MKLIINQQIWEKKSPRPSPIDYKKKKKKKGLLPNINKKTNWETNQIPPKNQSNP